MKYCPICESLLSADVEVYTRPRKSIHESVEIIGCENCVNTHWADEFFDEEELEEMEKAQDSYDNYLWDMSQEMKALMSFKGAGND